MSELSERDQATLREIEEQLAADDPKLSQKLARFGRHFHFRLPFRRR